MMKLIYVNAKPVIIKIINKDFRNVRFVLINVFNVRIKILVRFVQMKKVLAIQEED